MPRCARRSQRTWMSVVQQCPPGINAGAVAAARGSLGDPGPCVAGRRVMATDQTRCALSGEAVGAVLPRPFGYPSNAPISRETTNQTLRPLPCDASPAGFRSPPASICRRARRARPPILPSVTRASSGQLRPMPVARPAAVRYQMLAARSGSRGWCGTSSCGICRVAQ